MGVKTILSLMLSLLILSAFQCRKDVNTKGYKARLEIKGICMNYTIKVLEGNIDSSLIEANWTDPGTGKTYQNVFGLESTCTFPSDIKEGDEFYFIIGKEPQNCVQCLAYYPRPAKRLSIVASKTPIE